MKKLVLAMLVVLFSLQLSAQDKNGKRFYFDVTAKAANMNGNYALFGGGRAGYNIDEQFSVGLVGQGLVPNKVDKAYINQKGRNELRMGYLGVEGAYKYSLSDKFNVTGLMMIGTGRVDYKELPGHDYFFIMEPGVSLDYNLTDWFGMGYQISYRVASGVSYADVSNATCSGYATDFAFKFRF